MTVAAIIAPQVIDLKGANQIIQGASYFLEFQVKDVDGAIVNLTGVVPSTDLKCEFRDKTLQQGGLTTNCPAPQVYVSNAAQGKVLIYLPSSQTQQFDNQVLKGFYDIELTIGGLRYRIAQGAWENDALQVTKRY